MLLFLLGKLTCAFFLANARLGLQIENIKCTRSQGVRNQDQNENTPFQSTSLGKLYVRRIPFIYLRFLLYFFFIFPFRVNITSVCVVNYKMSGFMPYISASVLHKYRYPFLVMFCNMLYIYTRWLYTFFIGCWVYGFLSDDLMLCITQHIPRRRLSFLLDGSSTTILYLYIYIVCVKDKWEYIRLKCIKHYRMCFTKVLNLRRNIGVWLTGVGYKNNSFSLTGLLLFNLI